MRENVGVMLKDELISLNGIMLKQCNDWISLITF